MGISVGKSWQTQRAFLWPAINNAKLLQESSSEYLNFRRNAILVVAAFALLICFVVILDRISKGDMRVAALSSISCATLLLSLGFDRYRKDIHMTATRWLLNGIAVIQLNVSTYLNGVLPVNLSPLFPVVLYLMNSVRTGFVVTALTLLVQGAILVSLFGSSILQPDIVRIILSTLGVWVALHVGNCMFISLFMRLEQKLEEQVEFSSVLAHEIRTPLATMSGSVEVARLEGAFTKYPQTYNNLKRSADSLLELVNSTLDYRRIRSGHFEMQEATFSTREFLDDVVFQASMLPNAGELYLTYQDSTPADLMTVTDRTKVKQILMNLLANAVRFSPNGGRITLLSRFDHLTEPPRWYVSVVDEGIGIAKEDLDRIFSPFTQVSQGADRKFGGTGLGLSLSQVIARALGGDITVKSILHKGSSFTLSLPVRLVPFKEDIAQASQHQEPMAATKHLTVLLVEDHPLNAKLNAKLLQGFIGVAPTVVSDAQAAIALIQAGVHFDVVLMDINLGEGMTGLEATRYIKQEMGLANPPVIVALTAGILPLEKEAALQTGMDDFLSKPLRQDELNNVLQKTVFGQT